MVTCYCLLLQMHNRTLIIIRHYARLLFYVRRVAKYLANKSRTMLPILRRSENYYSYIAASKWVHIRITHTAIHSMWTIQRKYIYNIPFHYNKLRKKFPLFLITCVSARHAVCKSINLYIECFPNVCWIVR